MQIILERDSIDKPLTFNVCLLQPIFHTSVFTYYIFMQRCFQSSNSAEGLHFSAFHFVGISDSKVSLQKLIDVVYSYCSKLRLRANVSKSAVKML